MPDQEQSIRKAALEYHRLPRPARSRSRRPSSSPTSATSRSPIRPAWPPPARRSCAIRREARNLTSRANLVGVITNGTAVLGLGAIGPLAAKPVMEGKAVLFKKFAGIDCFDIELDERDPDKLVDIIAALEPTFGGINLEDIKAPECFYVERKLRERMKIPVFHDDQHGTAIIVGAAVLNGLSVVGKDIAEVKLVVLRRRRGGARLPRPAGELGLPAREHLGHRHQGRGLRGPQGGDGPEQGALRAARPSARTLDEVIAGADIFLGLSAGGVLKPEMVKKMAREAADPRARQPGAGDPAGAGEGGASRLRSSPPAARTTRTRSTTSCASRSSSAARSTSAPPRSTRR